VTNNSSRWYSSGLLKALKLQDDEQTDPERNLDNRRNKVGQIGVIETV